MAPKAQGAPPEPPPPDSAAGGSAEDTGSVGLPASAPIVPAIAPPRASDGSASAAPKRKGKLTECGRKFCHEKVPEETTCILYYTTGLITTKGTGPGPGSWTRRSIHIPLHLLGQRDASEGLRTCCILPEIYPDTKTFQTKDLNTCSRGLLHA